jgi:hypothetical protein
MRHLHLPRVDLTLSQCPLRQPMQEKHRRRHRQCLFQLRYLLLPTQHTATTPLAPPSVPLPPPRLAPATLPRHPARLPATQLRALALIKSRAQQAPYQGTLVRPRVATRLLARRTRSRQLLRRAPRLSRKYTSLVQCPSLRTLQDQFLQSNRPQFLYQNHPLSPSRQHRQSTRLSLLLSRSTRLKGLAVTTRLSSQPITTQSGYLNEVTAWFEDDTKSTVATDKTAVDKHE